MDSARSSTLIYDGECGFCQRAAQWLIRRSPHADYRLIGSQELSDEELVTMGLNRHDVESALWWVDVNTIAAGAPAIAAVLGRGSFPLPILDAVLSLPAVRPVAALLYRIVARYRHLLPGATQSCDLRGRQRDDAASAT